MTAEKERARARAALAKAKALTERAKAEGRALRPEEDSTVQEYLGEAKAASETAKRLDLIDGKSVDEDGSPADGWAKAARELGKSRTAKVETTLSDLIGAKAPLTPPNSDIGQSRRPGIAALVEDTRRFFQALPQEDPGAGTLHIEHLEIASHGLASGTVERDPMSTSAKAEVDLDINFESVDLKQFAATCSTIPSQLFESVDNLELTIRATIGLELEEALDMHVYKVLDDSAGVAVVSGGSNFQTKLRRAISDIRKQGGEANIAFVSDADMETMDNLSSQSTDLPRGYPWGLRLIPSPLLGTGEFIVLDSSGVRLHKGGASFLRDPYSGLTTNTERVRLEFNALAELIEPRKVVKSGASLVT